MILRRLTLTAALLFAACKPSFNPADFRDTDALFRAAMTEYDARRFDNAAKAFERLSTELPARDPRLPQVFLLLGRSQARNGDRLLAARSFSRIYESFPQDTLADDGLLESGMQYKRLWRKPVLDAQYGDEALKQFQTLQSLYPNSALVPQARQHIAELDEWFAEKDYETGYHYLKRKAYDSAIIYFRDVIRLHPAARKTRDAYLRLHEAYRAINYREDAKELCATMRTAYPQDREVMRTCGPTPAPAPAATG